jgi:hypothetical protein
MRKINFLDPEFLAQLVHIFAGLSITSLLYIKIGFPNTYYALTIFMFGVLLKETIFDPKYETTPPQPFFWQGALDFVMYFPGIALALAIILL